MHYFWLFFLITYSGYVFTFYSEKRYTAPATTVASGLHPWVVRMKDTVGFFTGVLISDRHILTVAHALDAFPDADCLEAQFKNAIAPFSVKAGRYISHPEFAFLQNDLAIIELDQKIPLDKKGIELPRIDNATYFSNIYKINPVYSAGYADSGTLKRVRLEWSSLIDGVYKLRYAGTAEEGDSGGPLFYYLNGIYYLLGIQFASYVTDGNLNYYQAISGHLEFITNNTHSDAVSNEHASEKSWKDVACIIPTVASVIIAGSCVTIVVFLAACTYKKFRNSSRRTCGYTEN